MAVIRRGRMRGNVAPAPRSVESAWVVAQGAEQGRCHRAWALLLAKAKFKSGLHFLPAGWPGASVELNHCEPVSFPSRVPRRHHRYGRKQDRPSLWSPGAYVLLERGERERAHRQMSQSAPYIAVNAMRREANPVTMWVVARVAFQRWSHLT